MTPGGKHAPRHPPVFREEQRKIAPSEICKIFYNHWIPRGHRIAVEAWRVERTRRYQAKYAKATRRDLAFERGKRNSCNEPFDCAPMSREESQDRRFQTLLSCRGGGREGCIVYPRGDPVISFPTIPAHLSASSKCPAKGKTITSGLPVRHSAGLRLLLHLLIRSLFSSLTHVCA